MQAGRAGPGEAAARGEAAQDGEGLPLPRREAARAPRRLREAHRVPAPFFVRLCLPRHGDTLSFRRVTCLFHDSYAFVMHSSLTQSTAVFHIV